MTSIKTKPRTKTLTHYQILGVAPRSTLKAIHESYLELAFSIHSDRNPSPDADEQMKLLNFAWSVLKNAENRKIYDERLRIEGRICGECDGCGKKWKFPGAEVMCESCKGTGVNV